MTGTSEMRRFITYTSADKEAALICLSAAAPLSRDDGGDDVATAAELAFH